MREYFISGIQQVGIGVENVYQGWEFYRKHLGMDLPIFDEAAEAKLMLPYTKGEIVSRHAVLALNYQGGGGLEIWQYTSRTPEAPKNKPRFGDLGINTIKYKCLDVDKKHLEMKNSGVKLLSDPSTAPFDINHFFAEDDFGNVFEVSQFDDWHKSNLSLTGGVCGAAIGVRDIQKSIGFYRDVLGYDQVIESTIQGQDIGALSNEKVNRVLLKHSKHRKGAFSNLLGNSMIELIQTKTFEPVEIFENRQWGDLGYIHLCFDITGMDDLKNKCQSLGHPFTVDSGQSFDMGEAAGRFSYIEDPDGTLIEFVETHKIPIMKKWNWYLDLRKRDRKKPLSKIILKGMSLSRVKKSVV